MSELVICTWRWGDKYPALYLERLRASIARNMTTPYRFGVFAPQAEDAHLTEIKGCFARLRMFDPEWQEQNRIAPGSRVLCIDLDVVVTGQLEPLFDRDEDFVILQGANASNPCPYNGSLWMFRAGSHTELWNDFSLEEAAKIPRFEFPDDQGWMAAKVPGAGAWHVGSQSGVYAFQKPGWPRGDILPADARLVVFPGWRDPQRFAELGWIRRHWST